MSTQRSVFDYGAGTNLAESQKDLPPERLRELYEKHGGVVVDMAADTDWSRLTVRKRLEDAGLLDPPITRVLPEDVGLSPLCCGRCGAQEIGGHPCPECGYDPREGGPG